jgi:hypothetical protein
MNRWTRVLLAWVIGGTLLAALATSAPGSPGAPVQPLEWKDLVPAGFDPNELLRKYYADVAKLKDSDPQAERLAADLRKVWESAPVVDALNNKTVRLSGFLVTLEGDGKAVSEFLLVPFFGACVHVPPPPSNQIVLVRTGSRPFRARQMFQMVSVTGRLRTELVRSDLASASYVIEASHVEPRSH